MKKRFIVLIDFSAGSENLLRYAADWCGVAGAELMLVHHSDVSAAAMIDSDNRAGMVMQANQEALENLKLLAQKSVPKHMKISFIASEKNLESILHNLLDEAFENLIFVGLKNAGLVEKMLLGSVALRVINNINNIVVAMPADITDYSHEKIFVGVSEKHPLNVLELNKFLRFIDKENTTITFFYLSRPNENIKGIEKQLTELANLFADNYNTCYAVYEGRDPFDDIKKVINNKTDEILIIQRGSRLFADQLFRRFLINDLVIEGQTPLVILP